jgi:beta-lactamase class A
MEAIQKTIDNAGGIWGISLFDLDTNERFELHENELFYAASVIKVPIMIAAYSASHHGELQLGDRIVLKREDMVGGSGVLQHMTPGTRLTVYDLLTLMIIQSDNTATNILIELIGTEKIQQVMMDIGMEKSCFYHKMMIAPVDRKGFNGITAYEMTTLLKKLVTGKLVSVYACEQMIEIMKKQQIRETFPSKLPENHEPIIGAIKEFELAHKTGNVSGIRHDSGIFYVENRKMIATVLSKGVGEIDSLDAFGRIGLEIYNYLKQSPNRQLGLD